MNDETWSILIVEDEALLADEMQDRLTKLGHTVVGVVDTGADAIRTAAEHLPDLILMDIRIKGPMNGIEAADQIFAAHRIPVIFASAHSDEDTLKRSEIAAQYGYIVKPYRELDLVTAIRVAMNRRAAESGPGQAPADLDAELAGAAGRGELELHYLPIVDLSTGDVVKAEALLRWNHPAAGRLPALAFVPYLEQSGAIVEVGEWIVDEALDMARRLHRELSSPISLSINVSAAQLWDPAKVSAWAGRLADATGAGPLGVEVPESVLVSDPERAREALSVLRLHGLETAIDDFGAGFLPPSILRQFDVDDVKVEAAFIRGIASSATDRSLTRSIVELAKSLGLRAIAKGVETAAQRDALAELGCDLAQGHLFSEPLGAAAFIEYVRSSSPIHRP